MFCSERGKEIKADAKFCDSCGASVASTGKDVNSTQPSIVVPDLQRKVANNQSGGTGCLFPLIVGGLFILGAITTDSTGVFVINLLAGIGILFFGAANR